MKTFLVFLFLSAGLVSNAQFTVKEPRELQHHYLFSTDNPDGTGHLDWGFHDSMVYKEVVIGGSVTKDGRVIKEDSFKTDKPFVIIDSAGIVGICYETDRGVFTILYSDAVEDLVALCIGFPAIKQKLNIYSVVHFW